MKREDFKTQGLMPDGTQINGIIRIYTDNMAKLSISDISTALLTSIKVAIKKICYISPSLAKKVAALSIAGLLTLGTLTGCSLNGEKQIDEPIISVSPTIIEETEKINYTVKFGDSLWSIAGMYRDNDREIIDEVDHICKLNDFQPKDILREGQVIILAVPTNRLDAFGMPNTSEKVLEEYRDATEWEKKEYFITEAFSNSKPAPENFVFERNRQEVFEGSDSQKGYLIEITMLKDMLKDMEENPSLYTQDRIDGVKENINSLYQKAVEVTQTTTGKTYGTDYILEQVLVSTENNNTKSLG